MAYAQVDRITLLAMGLRMRAVCTELRAHPRFAPKYWGVAWDKRKRRWRASYVNQDGRLRVLGFFARGADAALAVNAAIRRAGLAWLRPTNPVDAATGAPVPRPSRAPSSRIVGTFRETTTFGHRQSEAAN